MKTSELPKFPIVLFAPTAKMFVDNDRSLVSDLQEATIFPMYGIDPESVKECKQSLVDTIELMTGWFGIEIIPLSVSIKVESA
jgi:hypothetical protein